MSNMTEEKLKASDNNSKTSHIQLSKLLSEGIPGIDENVNRDSLEEQKMLEPFWLAFCLR